MGGIRARRRARMTACAPPRPPPAHAKLFRLVEPRRSGARAAHVGLHPPVVDVDPALSVPLASMARGMTKLGISRGSLRWVRTLLLLLPAVADQTAPHTLSRRSIAPYGDLTPRPPQGSAPGSERVGSPRGVAGWGWSSERVTAPDVPARPWTSESARGPARGAALASLRLSPAGDSAPHSSPQQLTPTCGPLRAGGTPGTLSTPARFAPSPAFAGTRDGCIFKSGTRGLGYYTDRQSRGVAGFHMHPCRSCCAPPLCCSSPASPSEGMGGRGKGGSRVDNIAAPGQVRRGGRPRPSRGRRRTAPSPAQAAAAATPPVEPASSRPRNSPGHARCGRTTIIMPHPPDSSSVG